jgi:hypothetical protein
MSAGPGRHRSALQSHDAVNLKPTPKHVQRARCPAKPVGSYAVFYLPEEAKEEKQIPRANFRVLKNSLRRIALPQ